MGERGKSKMESGKFCKAVSRVLQGRGQPGPAMHLQSVLVAVKMVPAPDLSLRGPKGAVAISGRQLRFRRWLSCDLVGYCEIATSACGLLAMTNLGPVIITVIFS